MPPEVTHERQRRHLCRLLMLFYVVLIGEGALRKWVLPGASDALVFLRDPVLLLILLAYARLGQSRPMRRVLALYGAAALLFVLCAACQGLTSGVSAIVLLFGFRNYLLFVPLCFAIRDAFQPADYARWIRLNLALAGPVAGIVLLQYASPPSAWINAVPGGSNEGVFLVVDGVVRPYGLFSFTLGHSAFAAWMLGTVLAATLARRALRLQPVWLAGAGTAVVAMGLLSGSRTTVLLAGSVVGVFLVVTMAFAPTPWKARGLQITLVLVGVVTIALLLAPSAVGNLLDRQTAAVASEGGTTERIGRVATDFLTELDRAPLFGFGMGAGTNIANYLANGRTDHVLAEYELTRVVQELGPIFGLAYIGLRWALLAWFVALATGAARRGNLQPACHLGFLLPLFLAHDITLQNTMIGMGWFAAGVFLSAVKLGPAFQDELRRVRRPVPAATIAWAGR